LAGPPHFELVDVSMNFHQCIHVHVAHIRFRNTYGIGEEMANWRLQTVKQTVKSDFGSALQFA
jgi:hypothetical protein